MRQLPLPISPEPPEDFDTLVVGPNAEAVAHLRALQPPAAPVYLWGPAGAGKTLMLRALAGHRRALGERVGWFDARSPLPWALDPGWGLVVLDQADALDADRQHAAFALFIDAGTHGVQWAAAGRLPPVDLALRDDLRTRLGWGHVFALKTLSDEEARSALRRTADHLGLLLAEPVIDYVLAHLPRDLGQLIPLLKRLDRYGLAEQRVVTIPLLKKMLADHEAAELLESSPR